MHVRRMLGLGIVAIGMLMAMVAYAVPAAAIGPNVVITFSANSISTNGTVDINFCMPGTEFGQIGPTSSGHFSSGLIVTNPAPDSATYNYPAAAYVVIPDCSVGNYTVTFGDSSPGWVLVSHHGAIPTSQTSITGTYEVDLNYVQSGNSQMKGAYFDTKAPFSVPEFPVFVLAIAASMVGMVLIRKRMLPVTALGP